jgi:hypothetical protein
MNELGPGDVMAAYRKRLSLVFPVRGGLPEGRRRATRGGDGRIDAMDKRGEGRVADLLASPDAEKCEPEILLFGPARSRRK